jgi:hypothetical protein
LCRNKKLSRLDADESIINLDSIRESPAPNGTCEQSALDHSISVPETADGGQRTTRQKNSKNLEEVKNKQQEADKTRLTEVGGKTSESRGKTVTLLINEQHDVEKGIREDRIGQTNDKKQDTSKADDKKVRKEADLSGVQLVIQENKEIETISQTLNDVPKENVPPHGHALNYQKLSEEFKLKECTIMLAQQPNSFSPKAVETIVVSPLTINNSQVVCVFLMLLFDIALHLCKILYDCVESI